MTTTTLTPEQTAAAIRSCWQNGNLRYLMRNTQRWIKKKWEVAKAKGFRRFYIESTRRLGKSSSLLIFFTELGQKNPNTKYGFFAPVKDGLLDYVEPLIRKTYEDCPEDLKPTFDRTRFLLQFKNGSQIIFRGSNNQQHRIRRGQEFHGAGIDEARDVDDLQELIESVIFPSLFSANGYLLISSTPADTRSHPLFEYRQRAELEGWIVKIPIMLASELDPTVYTKERIEEWKTETLKMPDGQEIWEREYECKWVVNRRKAAVPEWNTSAHARVFNPDPYDRFYHRYVGLDWGYRDFTAVVFAKYNFRAARLEVEGELTFSGQDVRSDLIADRINLLTSHLYPKGIEAYRQISDSADPILINEINRFPSMSFAPVTKSTLEAMLNEFRFLVAQGKVYVNPKCAMTIHALENAIWTDKRDKLDSDVMSHHFDHLMALVYMTRMIDWNVNPIPSDYMIDGVRVVDLNFDKVKKPQGESARALAAAFGGRL